jgi:protein involved in polysaccharide export with SLBB domain
MTKRHPQHNASRGSSHRLLLPLLLAMSCAACAAAPSGPSPATIAESPPALSSAPYTLIPGDLVTVKFYYNPELNEDLIIRPDGKITMQLIGEVTAAGLTPEALAANLTELYASELAAPNVSVIVRRASNQRVFVSGEVGKQGVITLTQGMTLYQAIQKAGGLLNTAQRSQVILIRRTADGQATGSAVDVRPIERGSAPQSDIALQPYDMVFVPRSKIADVNVIVDQYIRQNLPIQFAIPVF